MRILYFGHGQSGQQILQAPAKNYLIHNAEKYSVFSSIFLMSENDQYGRRLLLLGDTAKIFGFTF